MTERRCVKSVAARAVPGGVLGLIRGSLRLNHMLRWFTYDVGNDRGVDQPRLRYHNPGCCGGFLGAEAPLDRETCCVNRTMTERRCVKSVAARAATGGVLGLSRGSGNIEITCRRIN